MGSRKVHGDVVADVTPPIAAGSNEMVERVAIAIFVSWYEGSFCEPVSFYTDCDDTLANDYRRIARAAIAAMREPNDDMYEGVNRLDKMWKESNSFEIYRAMIDGALIGGPPSTDDDQKT